MPTDMHPNLSAHRMPQIAAPVGNVNDVEHDALPRLDVRDPEQLGMQQVIDFAEDVHEAFTRSGLPTGLLIAGAGR